METESKTSRESDLQPTNVEPKEGKRKEVEEEKKQEENQNQETKEEIVLRMFQEETYRINPSNGVNITLDENLLFAIKSCAFVLDSYLSAEQIISNLVYQSLIEIRESVESSIRKTLKQNPYKKLNQ